MFWLCGILSMCVFECWLSPGSGAGEGTRSSRAGRWVPASTKQAASYGRPPQQSVWRLLPGESLGGQR